MALAKPRKAPEAFAKPRTDGVALNTMICGGALVVLNSSGYAAPGSAATGLVARGVAVETADNSTGANGDVRVKTQSGVFGFKNKADDLVTLAEIGDVCYIQDDETVCKTATGKSAAGVVEFLEDGLVYVAVGTWPLQVGLLAANNLSDVGSAATARASIGANQFEQTVFVDSLVSGARYGFVAPKGLTITKIKSVLLGAALATGNATLQGKINGTNITNGLVTITQAGSAIGDVDTATPTAANVATEDQLVEVTVGGTNSEATARASVTFFGTY